LTITITIHHHHHHLTSQSQSQSRKTKKFSKANMSFDSPDLVAGATCASIPSMKLDDFVIGFSILLAIIWACAGAILTLAIFRLWSSSTPLCALLALLAVIYCACKCAHFSSDTAYMLTTPGLMFDVVARLLGTAQLSVFILIGRSFLNAPLQVFVVLRRVLALLALLAAMQVVGVVLGAVYFQQLSDVNSDGLIALLFLSDLGELAVGAVALFGASRCARAAKDGLLVARAQANIKWHHRFTTFGAIFCTSRLLSALVSIVLFALLVNNSERAPLRNNIELGALVTFFIEIVPMLWLVSALSTPPGDSGAPSPRWLALRRAVTAHRVSVLFLLVLTALLIVWGVHSSCFLDAAPLGAGLAAARGGAVPLYVLLPLTFVPVLYGFVSFLEAASFGTFFPRDAGDSIALHKWLAGLCIACAALHVAGHFSLLHAHEVYPNKEALPAAINDYFSDIEEQRRGIWMLPWITGFVLVGLFVLMWLSFACCRQRGSVPLFMAVHRVSAYGALVLVAVHGAGAILKPFPYMWIGVVIALALSAIDFVVKRRRARAVNVELRLCQTINQETQNVERVVVAQLLEKLDGVEAGAWAGVAFPTLHADDMHPFTVVWRQSGLHQFHIACTARWRSWTNELAQFALSTPPPLLPRLGATVCAAFRSEIADPAFLRAPHVVMVALGTGATPFIGVADAVAAAKQRRLRALQAADKPLHPDDIGFHSAESSDAEFGRDDNDDDDGPRLSLCHRSERHVLYGRVAAVDGESATVRLDSTEWRSLISSDVSPAAMPVEVRLIHRNVCFVSSADVGRTHDGRLQLFDVSVLEDIGQQTSLELAEAGGRALLSGVRASAAHRKGEQLCDLALVTPFAEWQKLSVAPETRLVLRTPARPVAELTAADVSTRDDEPDTALVRFAGAVAGRGTLQTVARGDAVCVRQTRTLGARAVSVADDSAQLDLLWVDWRDAVDAENGDDGCGGGVALEVRIGDQTVIRDTAAACRRDGAHVRVVLGRSVDSDAAVELKLARDVRGRVAREFDNATAAGAAASLVVGDLTPVQQRHLLDARWSNELTVIDERVGCAIASMSHQAQRGKVFAEVFG
jgi:hypothetical protein